MKQLVFRSSWIKDEPKVLENYKSSKLKNKNNDSNIKQLFATKVAISYLEILDIVNKTNKKAIILDNGDFLIRENFHSINH